MSQREDHAADSEGLEEGCFTEAQGGVRTVSSATNALASQVEQAAQTLQQVVK